MKCRSYNWKCKWVFFFWTQCIFVRCCNNIVTNNKQSHTRTVVRECCKDDYESLWKRLKFDLSPRKYGLTDRPPNLHRWLVITSWISPQCKILCRSDQGFFSPYGWNITPKMFVFWFFSEATTQTTKLIFTQKTSKDAVPRKDVPFGVFENKN